MTPLTRAQRFLLIGLLGLAALTRFLLVDSLEGQPYFYEPAVDSAAYDEWAQRIARGDVVGKEAFYQDPLYPYFLASLYKVLGRDLYLVRVVQCLLGVLGCAFLFGAGRRLGGNAVGFLALALAALYKPILFYETALLKECLAVVLVEAGIYLVTLDRKASWPVAGLAFGLAVLVRANLLLVVLVLAIALLLRKQVRKALLLATGTAAAILPVTIRNAVVAKDFVPTTYQLGANLYIGNHAGNTTGRYVPPAFVTVAAPGFEERDFRAEAELRRGRSLKPSEISSYWISRTQAEFDLGRFVRVTARRAAEYLNAYEVPDNYNYDFMRRYSWVLRLPLPGFWLLIPLAAAGMVLARRERARWGWLYLFVAVYFLSVIFFFVFARYRLPVVPALILFAAVGCVRLVDRLRSGPRPWAAGLLAFAALIQSAVAIGPRNFDIARYNLALHEYRGGRAAAAAAELEKVRHVAHPQWHYLRGLAHEEAGDPERALEAFHEAARLDPASADAAYHLALAYRRVEAVDSAIRWFAETLRRDPARLEALLEIGRCYESKQEWVRAKEVYARAAEKNWRGDLDLARLYARLGMWSEVRRHAARVLRLIPGQPDAHRLDAEARRRSAPP